MKWILRLIGGIVVLILVAAGGIMLLPTDRIAQIATDQIRLVTGRDVRISGDVSLSFWPVLGVRTGGFEVDNAPWAAPEPMLSAQSAAIGIDLAALLTGEIRITNIEAQSPTIRLEQRADGRASWQFTDAAGAAQIETRTDPDREAGQFSIQRLNVTDATIVYDAEGSDLISFSGVDLALEWPEREGAATLIASLQPATERVTANAVIDRFDRFLSGATEPVDVALEIRGGQAQFMGEASTAGTLSGQLKLTSADTDALFQNLGLTPPGLPNGLGRRIDLATGVALSHGRRLSLREISLELGANRITGNIDIDLKDVPYLSGALNLGSLDLSTLGAEEAPSSTASGWSNDPIDASGLAQFNGEVSLNADQIRFGELTLGKTQVVLKNDRSRLETALQELNLFEGLVTGELVVNNRNGLSVGGNLAARGLQMQDLLSQLLGVSRLTGQADAGLNFLAVGQSPQELVSSLSGRGDFAVGQGTFEGINLDQIMRGGDLRGGTTVFDQLTGSYQIENGLLQNNDLLLALRNYRADGAGEVDLGAQRMDYTFTPVAIRDGQGRGVAIPVRVDGPWSDLRIRPDLEGMIDLRVEEEARKLEERARQRLQEEIGGGNDPGQAVEDAVRDRIKQGLGKLFE